jgi:RNA-directed DNA polymerase
MEPLKGKRAETSSSESISTRLQRVAEVSRKGPEMVWTTLSQHIDLELLKRAYQRTRKDGATGIDGQSAKEYAENLEGNLQGLLDRFKDRCQVLTYDITGSLCARKRSMGHVHHFIIFSI